jgi:lipopolysaccharide transport system ATP-binding protein
MAFRSPLRRLIRDGRRPDETIWALDDVTFDVAPGEVVGVIGRNGSGKSTLLKIMSRITEPTSGQVELYGRVGSLLEVGTGFHAELSGRENIYLSGAILGMKKAEIDKKFDEIVAFAEIDQFIDTPVKRYSSGMYVRLAFAVAAHLEPEILLVDEVLAVGDVMFQRKCLGKMGDAARTGRTVLFVSHDMSAVGRLCPRAICLSGGRITRMGESREVIASYLASTAPPVFSREWSDLAAAPGDEFLRIVSVRVLQEGGDPVDIVRQDEPFILSIVYRVLRPMINANVGFEVSSQEGVRVFSSYDADDPDWQARGRETGLYRSDCFVPEHLLNEGTFFISVAAGIPSVKLCARAEDVLRLEVAPAVNGNSPIGRMGEKRAGVIAPALGWRVSSVYDLAPTATAAYHHEASQPNSPQCESGM